MVTISDIARKAKVSPNTVSRVINGNAEYTRPSFAKRAAKIRRIAIEMGYMPNTTAQSMRSGRHRSISLLTSPQRWSSALSNDLLFSLQNAVSALEFSLVLHTLSEGDNVANQHLPKIFRENCVDGVLVNITHVIPSWLEPMLHDTGVPFIWMGSKHESDCIYHDDLGTARGLTERLLKLGHKDIAYVDCAMPWNSSPAKWHFSNLDRMEGYEEAMGKAGLVPNVVRPDHYLEPNETVLFLVERIFSDNTPTAVITYNLELSGNALLFAAARCGLSIPDQMSFATFTPHANPCLNDLRLSHYDVNPDYSDRAVAILNEKINNRNLPTQPLALPMQFVEGETISAPRQDSK